MVKDNHFQTKSNPIQIKKNNSNSSNNLGSFEDIPFDSNEKRTLEDKYNHPNKNKNIEDYFGKRKGENKMNQYIFKNQKFNENKGTIQSKGNQSENFPFNRIKSNQGIQQNIQPVFPMKKNSEELKNFIKKKSEENKDKSEKNPKKNKIISEKKNYYGNLQIAEKEEIIEDIRDDYLDDYEFNINECSEDQYNQNRLLNHLDNLVNNNEDSDNQSEGEDDNNIINTNKEEEIEEVCFSGQELMNELNIDSVKENSFENDSFYDTEFSQIEQLKVELEKYLGLELFLKVYKFVDNTTDPREVKFNYEFIKYSMKRELKKEFTPEQINKALDKIYEIFSIVAQERLSNLRQ